MRTAYQRERHQPQTIWTLNQVEGDVPYLLGHFSSEPLAMEQARRVVAHDLNHPHVFMSGWQRLEDGTRELKTTRNGRTFHFRLSAWLLDSEAV